MQNSSVNKVTKPRRFSKKLLALIGIVLLVAVVALLELTNTTHFLHATTPATKIIKTAGTPEKTSDSDSKTAPSEQTEKTLSGPTGSTNSRDGTIVDTHGQSSSTPSSQWIVATSGNITVKQPSANAKLSNGSAVSGSAKVVEVQYRLIDNKTGVIAQGRLSVVNGNFSGTLQFSPSSTSGRLDIFSVGPDGTEINEVQIVVGL